MPMNFYNRSYGPLKKIQNSKENDIVCWIMPTGTRGFPWNGYERISNEFISKWSCQLSKFLWGVTGDKEIKGFVSSPENEDSLLDLKIQVPKWFGV